MDTFRISQEQIILLHQHAALGRLINGLIHNLNGPLHTLGIEMDLMGHVISKSDASHTPLAQDMLRRLKRMNGEFQNLSSLIRSVGARADLLRGPKEYLQLNSLLQQELEFLKANLYFKHNVKTTVDLAEGIGSMLPISDGLGLGIVWFLQGLVEEIERQKLDSLSVRTDALPSGAAATFTTGGGGLSPDFQGCLVCSDPPVLEAGHHERICIFLAVQILKSADVAIENLSNSSETSLRLNIPFPR